MLKVRVRANIGLGFEGFCRVRDWRVFEGSGSGLVAHQRLIRAAVVVVTLALLLAVSVDLSYQAFEAPRLHKAQDRLFIPTPLFNNRK
jgi:hypothetical protein